jgi:hypothetical protein
VRRVLAAAAVAGVLGVSSGCGGNATAASPTRLDGLFRLTAGHCTTAQAKPTGSYLVVVSAAQGHAVHNPRGGCANADYTVLRPGTDGGLTTRKFQGQPSPVFDAHRNSRAARIIAPVRFGPYRLGFATSPQDEQAAPTGAPAFPPPAAIVSGGSLQVDLRSLVLTYAGEPKSSCAQSYGVGCWELGSRSASGTYDAATHHFVIDWFTGESFTPHGDSIEVHLEGTVVPGAS